MYSFNHKDKRDQRKLKKKYKYSWMLVGKRGECVLNHKKIQLQEKWGYLKTFPPFLQFFWYATCMYNSSLSISTIKSDLKGGHGFLHHASVGLQNWILQKKKCLKKFHHFLRLSVYLTEKEKKKFKFSTVILHGIFYVFLESTTFWKSGNFYKCLYFCMWLTDHSLNIPDSM